MSKNLWTTKFEKKDVNSPKKIIADQCAFLSQMTKGEVSAKIKPYDGMIQPFFKFPVKKSSDNTQSKLGEQGSSLQFKYEFFITTRLKTDYKYRVCFISYTDSVYPVNLITDEDIANEIGISENSTCENEESFIETFGKILNSNKLKSVVEKLMALS